MSRRFPGRSEHCGSYLSRAMPREPGLSIGSARATMGAVVSHLMGRRPGCCPISPTPVRTIRDDRCEVQDARDAIANRGPSARAARLRVGRRRSMTGCQGSTRPPFAAGTHKNDPTLAKPITADELGNDRYGRPLVQPQEQLKGCWGFHGRPSPRSEPQSRSGRDSGRDRRRRGSFPAGQTRRSRARLRSAKKEKDQCSLRNQFGMGSPKNSDGKNLWQKVKGSPVL